MALIKIKKSQLQKLCSGIILGDMLGEGGNGRVFEGTTTSGDTVAVKFMLNDNTKRYARFRDEVLVVTQKLKDSARVVPILEHHLPEKISDADVPWYVMPRAVPLKQQLADANWATKLAALVELGDGLKELHALKVAHRDIKPENLFFLDGSYRYGDFGLAAFPDREQVTVLGEPVGPAPGFIAPEMMSHSDESDVNKADVYSFAKTVWAVMAGRPSGFPGHYVASSPFGLSVCATNILVDFSTEPLDVLLADSTEIDPILRPSAASFASRLHEVRDVQQDFHRLNIQQWGAAERETLLAPGLTRAVWESPSGIAAVLNLLSRRDGLNHMFFPSGGGMAVERAFTGEGGTMVILQLVNAGLVIVQPLRLTLERFGEQSSFSYAVLETRSTPALGEDTKPGAEYERLVQINDFDYAVDDGDEYEPENIYAGNRCERYLRGGLFVLAPTQGVYNRIDGYDGSLNKLGVAGIREHFQKLFSRQISRNLGFGIMRHARIVPRPELAAPPFQLLHLSIEELGTLIEFEDALVKTRAAEDAQEQTFGFEQYVLNQPSNWTGQKKEALILVERLSVEKRAELVAMMRIGRTPFGALDLATQTEEEARELHQPSYLVGRLEHGLLRHCLSKFGLKVTADASPKDRYPYL